MNECPVCRDETFGEHKCPPSWTATIGGVAFLVFARTPEGAAEKAAFIFDEAQAGQIALPLEYEKLEVVIDEHVRPQRYRWTLRVDCKRTPTYEVQHDKTRKEKL